MIGVKWILRYHLGSIALGSAIIAIVQMIRIIFEYYRTKIQKASKNNPVVKALLCITGYLLWYLEKVVKFITKNAYIQIALTSKNFCMAAVNAFCLVIKNAARFGVVNSIGCIFMFIGKLFIIVTTCITCYLLIDNVATFSDNVSGFPVGILVVVAIICYFVGSLFMSVFSFSSDTILQCFLLDEEIAQHNPNRVDNRPPEMRAFVEDLAKKKGGCC